MFEGAGVSDVVTEFMYGLSGEVDHRAELTKVLRSLRVVLLDMTQSLEFKRKDGRYCHCPQRI